MSDWLERLFGLVLIAGILPLMGVGRSRRAVVVGGTNRLQLETGDFILMENSDFIAQE